MRLLLLLLMPICLYGETTEETTSAPVYEIIKPPIKLSVDPTQSIEHFGVILNNIQKEVVEKAPTVATLLGRTIEKSKAQFSQITENFVQDAFKAQRYVRMLFNDLCEIIGKIGASLGKGGTLKPRHIRWLSDKTIALSQVVLQKLSQNKLTDPLDSKTAVLVFNFFTNLHKKILYFSSRHIGTTFDQWVDPFYKFGEFYVDNWWATIPATVGAIATIAGVHGQFHRHPTNPATWNHRTDTEPTEPQTSLWTKYVGGIASLLISVGLYSRKSSFIRYSGGLAGEPIGMALPASAQEVVWPQYDDKQSIGPDEALGEYVRIPREEPRRFNRNYPRRVITQIPCLPQQDLTCGIRALFNAVLIHEILEADVLDFTPLLDQDRLDQFFVEVSQYWANNPEALFRLLRNHVYSLRRYSDEYVTEKRDALLANPDEIMNQPIMRRIMFSADHLEHFIQDCDFCVPIQGEVGGSLTRANISFIENLPTLKMFFSNTNLEINRIVEGDNLSHILQNIRDFRARIANRQIIIVCKDQCDGKIAQYAQGVIRRARGTHWFVMVIDRDDSDPDGIIDYILLINSNNRDIRDSNTVRVVYGCFATDQPQPGTPRW